MSCPVLFCNHLLHYDPFLIHFLSSSSYHSFLPSFLLENFSTVAALKTCNLLSVRGNYCPAASHSTSQVNNNNNNNNSNHSKNNNNSSRNNSLNSTAGKYDIMLSAPPLLDFARSPLFTSTIQRSMSYAAVGALCGNDTDHNTTNSNSDNDSDSKSSTRGKSFQHNHSTDSEASAAPSLLPSATSISPLTASRLTALSVPSLNGLENKIGGMGVFSVGKDASNNVSYPLNRSEKGSVSGDQVAVKREIVDSKCSPGSYHLTYQTISYSGNSSSNASALPSPRDHDIPLPL